MKAPPHLPLLALALALGAGPAFGQSGQRPEGKRAPQQQMSQEQRQRMRDDMRDVYRDRGERNAERARPERPRPMTPAEREKLRRDIQDANRDLRR
ncbi:MAG: hypothetical protein ACJ8G4_21745 [Burkholderiales bacterium]